MPPDPLPLLIQSREFGKERIKLRVAHFDRDTVSFDS